MSKAWSKTKLGDVLQSVDRAETVDAAREYRLLGVRWYGEGFFEKDRKLGQEIKAQKVYRVHKGDFAYNRLFAWKGSFAVADDEADGCYVSNEFPCFEPVATRVDAAFLKWWFRRENAWLDALGLSSGATPTSRNRLKEQQFLAMEIPLPPLAEQRRIVARIEELAAQIHEAATLRRKSSEQAKALWERSASAIFDRAGESYPIRPLADMVSIRGGGTPSKSDPFYWGGQIPWITPKDMKVRELRDAIDHISDRATKETAAKLIDPGAVLVVVRGMILAHTFPSAVLRAPAAINQDMKALLPRKELLPEYLCAMFWAYNSRILQSVEKSTHDTRKFETEKLLDTKIAVPPLNEQRRIVAELDALQAEVDALKGLQSETAAELDALLPAILDRAFKGEL